VRAPDPVMLLGYWNQPEATEEKFVDVAGDDGATHRWLRTGDLGRVDGDGYFWFRSRDDDVIISAGYRIGPAEIEECISSATRTRSVIGCAPSWRPTSTHASSSSSTSCR
jgi:acetyl-CoA synthetase